MQQVSVFYKFPLWESWLYLAFPRGSFQEANAKNVKREKFGQGSAY